MKFNITLNPSQVEALTAAQQFSAPDKTPEEYLQSVVDGACASYATQYVVESVESLKTKMRKLNDDIDIIRAEKQELRDQRDAEKAKAETVTAELAALKESPTP